MSNEMLWVLFIIFDFSIALLAMWLFGKHALYMIVIFGIIFCNIQVLKLVTIFGTVVTLGNVVYGSIFLATDLLCECYSKKEAQRAVMMGFFTLIVFSFGMYFTLQFVPSTLDVNHELMLELFQQTPRIVVGSIIAYIFSQTHDVWAYSFLKKKTKGKHLWLRNNYSTMVSQIIDTILFVMIAFYGVYEMDIVWSIGYTTLMFKWTTALLDTPVVYIGKWILSHNNDSYITRSV